LKRVRLTVVYRTSCEVRRYSIPSNPRIIKKVPPPEASIVVAREPEEYKKISINGLKRSFVERLIRPLPYKALDGAKTTVQNFVSS
jgi:hypothetical protein